jgi:hypothetical protein
VWFNAQGAKRNFVSGWMSSGTNSTEDKMRSECIVEKSGVEKSGSRRRRIVSTGIAMVIAGALTVAPLVAAGNPLEENRMSSERNIDRNKVESLQRWVSAGHSDWCRDPRVVAATELWRLAPDYSGDALDLNEVQSNAAAQEANRLTFEWAPVDGRALYRVTVERFDWLLPIAKNPESIVWVPTGIEIRTHP